MSLDSLILNIPVPFGRTRALGSITPRIASSQPRMSRLIGLGDMIHQNCFRTSRMLGVQDFAPRFTRTRAVVHSGRHVGLAELPSVVKITITTLTFSARRTQARVHLRPVAACQTSCHTTHARQGRRNHSVSLRPQAATPTHLSARGQAGTGRSPPRRPRNPVRISIINIKNFQIYDISNI